MYTDRSNDLDSRVSNVLDEAPKILSAIEKINDCLKDYYNLKEQTSPLLCGFKRTQTFFNYIDDYYLEEGWDYTKEFLESLQNLNESVLNAYIVFLEAERETLIKRWNEMAKELKPKKS